MKRTQLKDALRNIWKQKVSFLSVIVIAFLGVTTFLGINFSDGALRKNGSLMYNAVNYRDLELISTSAFSPDDLDAILKVEGVADAEPVWQTGAKATVEGKRQDINVISLTQRVNQPQIIEGRMPESAEECAVEQRLSNDMGWRLGDTVMAQNSKDEAAQFLKNNRFTIVGIANHPDHTSMSIPDTLYVMVQKDAFDMDALDNGFMKAEVIVDKPAGIDRFSSRYEAVVSAVSARLEEVGAQRASIRDKEGRDKVQSQLDEAQAKLDDAQEQLQKARAELDEGWNKLDEGDKQIDENEAKLVDGQTQLMTSQAQLMAGRDKLAEGEVKLAKAEVELSMGKTALETARKQLEQGRELLVESWDLKEDAIEKIRDTLRAGLGSAGNNIKWASRKTVNVDSSKATARYIYITESFRFDLKKSLKSNVTSFINSGIIPDAQLIDLYRALTMEDGK